MKPVFFKICTFLLVLVAFSQPALANFKVKKEKNIPYAGTKNAEQMLDVYAPDISRMRLSRPLPVHVYVHGGAWNLGDKKRSDYMGEFYAKQGAIFVSLNYRLAPETQYPGFCEDLAKAMRWVVDNIENYGGNPRHIVLSGHSAGAHLVALMATHPKFLNEQGLSRGMFKAVVPVDTASFNLLIDPYGAAVKQQIKFRENAFGTNLNVYADASPTLQAQNAGSAKLSRFEIFVSSKRPDAVEQSQAFDKALKGSGNSSKLMIIDGLNHAKMNQAIADPSSPIAKTIMRHLGIEVSHTNNEQEKKRRWRRD